MRTGRVWGWGLVVVLTAVATYAEPPAESDTAIASVDPSGDVPYDPTGRRDPFRPPRVGAAPHTGERRTPLQRYEIGQLHLVAIIYDTLEPRAVVEDEQGLGYIVKAGTPIGPSGGVVRAIERGRVLITEQSVDYYGEQRLNEVTMELRTAERGKE